MLINSDLQALSKYLNPHKSKLQSKGITSIQSRVANLSDINTQLTHTGFVQAMKNAFQRKYEGLQIIHKVLKSEEMGTMMEIKDICEDMRSWEWRYGRTPKFNNSLVYKFDWALIEVNFFVERGIYIYIYIIYIYI